MAIPNWPAYVDDTGTGEDGTDTDKAFFDAIHDALDDALRGITNPGTTVSAIVDEVIQARGSKASLDLRLDASLQDDGLIADIAANYASGTHVGLVSLAAQSFAGLKNFIVQPTMRQGADTGAVATVSGVRNVQVNTVANVGVGATTLHSHAMGANALDQNGKMIRLTTHGRFGATANTKTYTVTIGGVTVLTFASAGNAVIWRVIVEILRTGNATGNVSAKFEHGPNTDNPVDDNRLQSIVGVGVNWLAGETIATVGQSSAASNDLMEDVFIVEVIG